ncbi:MAG TPA: hypothetical protein DF296_02325 [Candidatus Margulisbacteria bacterium]|nr:MAG: hypothetical protein A2X43_09775 [Candidatus Margulisbacteria bacterium GWD2_39_127]OGI04587.1 MAG: hypothetical protein A2X42_07755 [Candidatus Margulisbacteria bacterium GWF2_38_17]OGI11881.1 MAG: hypothetical protein A2X41_11515 [Candidatus Margulisbacteria bacterium GWE2_39_32]HAR62224.1 hypothetical protein [Candidatus Margulisiibacteriota bacterium]HCT84015.1 hypothetical protein [Candidatus Margulisiibacteriota bacterium]
MINKRKILLTPEIGDWTLYLPEDISKDVKVGAVGISKFDRLSREELVQSHKMHYVGFEKLTDYLIKTFKLKVELYSVDVLQIVYKNVEEQLGEDFFQVSVTIEDNFTFCLYFKNIIANILVDRSLGGAGQMSEENLSQIEQKLFEKITEYILSPFLAFWDIDKTKIKVTEVINGNKEDLSLNHQSSYVMFEGKVAIGNNNPGSIIFGYGRESIIELIRRYEANEKKAKRRTIELKKSTQQKIKIKFNVEVGTTEISMKELMSLSEGDIIKLDTPIKSFIRGNLVNSLSFNCVPGIKNDKYAIQVVNVPGHNEDEEPNKNIGISFVSKLIKKEPGKDTSVVFDEAKERERNLLVPEVAPVEESYNRSFVIEDSLTEAEFEQYQASSEEESHELNYDEVSAVRSSEIEESIPPTENVPTIAEEIFTEEDNFSWDINDKELKEDE